MAQVLPAERDLRRVIGDADGAGDRQVEGLGEQELLEIYRSMVQLRTYDERSVVYHSQGRIGTYAIFWNHEGMQAGAFHALEDEDWIFPSYRESAIGLLRGMPACDRAVVVARSSRRLVEPRGLSRRVDLRPDRDARSARGGSRLGEEAQGGARRGDRVLRRRRDVGRRVSRRRELRRRSRGAPLVLFCNNNGWAISTPVEAQTRALTLADKAVGYGMPGVRVDGTRCPRLLRGDARSGSACAQR